MWVLYCEDVDSMAHHNEGTRLHIAYDPSLPWTPIILILIISHLGRVHIDDGGIAGTPLAFGRLIERFRYNRRGGGGDGIAVTVDTIAAEEIKDTGATSTKGPDILEIVDAVASADVDDLLIVRTGLHGSAAVQAHGDLIGLIRLALEDGDGAAAVGTCAVDHVEVPPYLECAHSHQREHEDEDEEGVEDIEDEATDGGEEEGDRQSDRQDSFGDLTQFVASATAAWWEIVHVENDAAVG
mmetsp:Transcript_1765/g.4881  ORF Transcript_1765/g.4881 Transcript_1765/m.4881 type:complete len:240 (+) Transcript_1765:212-931(+)